MSSAKTLNKAEELAAQINRLNLFCGNNFVTGWINIDPCIPRPRHKLVLINGKYVAMNYDNGTLPFLDNSQIGCYLGFEFQRLSLVEAELLLKDIYRILVPGGILRIAAFDLFSICREIVEGSASITEHVQMAETYIAHPSTSKEQREMLKACLNLSHSPAVWLNATFYAMNYRFIYDQSSLSALCAQAGFNLEKIVRRKFSQSGLADIKLLEREPVSMLYLEMER